MPNYCHNTLEISHNDPAMIARAKTAFEERRLLQEFCPFPKELIEYKNWWDWCVNEWGTKWDVGGDDGCITSETPNSLSLSFYSAWSPPTEAYRKLEELGFSITAYYYEGGCAFCGYYNEGMDDCFSIDGNSKWVKENIPDYIDEAFCISENMAEWEAENKEENEDA